MKEILCEYHRNGDVESVHRISLVALEAGKPAMVRGAVDHSVFMRSCAKPFQGLTVVESGAVDAYGFSGDEIAVICGSHPGEPEHVRAASSILKKAKLTVGHLQCGAHPPSGSRGLRDLIRSGKEPTAIHNNCSGKHSGMVSATKFMRAPLDSYLKPGHPLQKGNLKNVARFAEMKPGSIEIGVDGCSAPTFGLPLRAMARAIATFSSAPGTPQRVRDAMMAHPVMVGRPCVTLMSAAPGRLVAKGGAEGVYLCGFPGKHAGIALKVEDGNARAWVHVLHAVIRKLGWLEKDDLARLSKAADPDLRNHAGRRVGEIRVKL
jgi:L-asparaginase II